MQKFKVDKGFKALNYFMFIMVFVVKIIIDVLNEKNFKFSINDNLKYFIFMIAIAFCLFQLFIYINKGGKCIFKKELFFLLVICSVFLFYSSYLAREVNMSISTRTYVEIAYLIMPALYSFCIVNIYTFKELEKLMKILFWVYLILYMYSINIFSVSINDILNISFTKSNSYFESSIFAFPMLVLFFFFSYYRNSNKRYWIGSFIFTVLTFKRMIMVWAIILFVLDNSIEIRFNIKRKWKYIFVVIFICGTIIYYQALTDTGVGKEIVNLLAIDLENGTMGRKWFLNLLLNGSHPMFGYGSSSIILGEIFNIGDIKYLEMDLVKIYLELGIVCLSIFILYFWKLTKNNLFSIIMMISIFMNLLVSHSLTDPFEWTIIYLTLICISENSSNRSDLTGKKKYVFKYR